MTSTRGRISPGSGTLVVRVQLGLSLDVLAQDVAPEPDRNFTQLVACVRVRRYREDLVEFFERECLGLGYEQEDQEPADDATKTLVNTLPKEQKNYSDLLPCSVPPESSLRRKRTEQTRERNSHNKVTESPQVSAPIYLCR